MEKQGGSAGLQPETGGTQYLIEFWKKVYLEEFVGSGGSKIKFVTGKPGSGKTYFLNRLAETARENGYLCVQFSACTVWLHDFKEIYLEILRQVDLKACLEGCALRIIREMGIDPEDIAKGQTLMDYLSGQGEGDAATRRELRNQLNTLFRKDPLMDNNFAEACALLTGGMLGHPVLERTAAELLMGWLHADRTVRLASVRALGLSPARITKLNARHMLRSLCEVICKAGYKGLLILIDDLDIVQSAKGTDALHYTKMRRDDTYESIRQLIDEIDSLRNVMFVFGFDRVMIDNENQGLKSYQALWMRIQNEIVGARFNCFADIANLDVLAEQMDTPEYLVELSRRFAADARLQAGVPRVLDLEQARDILDRSKINGVGLPEAVLQATLYPVQEGEKQI